ncbi:MAG: rRNA pseudouridine synthase [Firmicutes bacterium]|nr:rRNA pseudouridine synthase [Bacillota bacterium]
MKERLHKVIAQAGVCSRRRAEELIQAGRVKVNGDVVTRLGQKVDPDTDSIAVDDVLITRTQPKVYLMLHKPTGYITTVRDPQRRPTVMDLVSADVRLFPIGRLDYESEGLLILTNDGDLAYRLTHPSFEVVKTYEVWVAGYPDRKRIGKLKTGIRLEDGLAQARRVVAIGSWEEGSRWEVDLIEGRKRQVRRMFEAITAPVKRLIRTKIGPLKLGQLPAGKTRALTPTEIAALYSATKSDSP